MKNSLVRYFIEETENGFTVTKNNSGRFDGHQGETWCAMSITQVGTLLKDIYEDEVPAREL